MKVSVGIKAFNEETHIAGALASALAAVESFGGEVILADSGSTDRTIEIARGYPVRIVQLANHGERCCGIAAQLAFQSARGDYFYLLDGDMVLDADFLPAAIDFLDTHQDFAAVGGLLCERNTRGQSFQILAKTVATNRNWKKGDVDRLDGGGLYRASAVREVGYFADRNLHAFEEFELAARLQTHGWRLMRIAMPAVDHYGYTMGGYRLLWRRVKTGYSGASGEVLRGALGKTHLPFVLRRLEHIRYGAAVVAWWLMLIVGLIAGKWLALVGLMLVPLLFLSWRRRSFRLGLYSFAAWNVSALGLLSGFFRERALAGTLIAAVDLTADNSSGA